METKIKFDERVERYEKRTRIVDGHGGVVAIDEGTRVYREMGHGEFFNAWLTEVQEAFNGELVPFEWVADYVGISRAGLHKRVKKGGLTVLVYEMSDWVPGILGGVRERMRREYKFVPKTECDSWRELLLERQDEK